MLTKNKYTGGNMGDGVGMAGASTSSGANKMMVPTYSASIENDGRDTVLTIRLQEPKSSFNQSITIKENAWFLDFRVKRAKKQLMKRLRKRMQLLGAIKDIAVQSPQDESPEQLNDKEFDVYRQRLMGGINHQQLQDEVDRIKVQAKSPRKLI